MSVQVERGSELTFASDKLRDASSHCSTVVRGLWIVAVLHAVLMGGYIWSGVSGRAVPLQDLGIALYDDFFGLGVIVVTLLSLSFSAGVALWWLRWQCAIGRAAGHMGFMMRGWWNFIAWVVPGLNVVAPLVLVGRMARSMRANLPLFFLGAWWLLWLGLSWRQIQLIVEPRGEWTSDQAYFTALAMFLWLLLDFTAMRVAMGLTVAGWRSLEKVSAERGATATEINIAVAGAREFSPVQNVSWSGVVRGRGSAIGRRVASGSKSALAAASAGTAKVAKRSKTLVESAAAGRKAQGSAAKNAEHPKKTVADVSMGTVEETAPHIVDSANNVRQSVEVEQSECDADAVTDISDNAIDDNADDGSADEAVDNRVEADESDDADNSDTSVEDTVVDLRDSSVGELKIEQGEENTTSSGVESGSTSVADELGQPSESDAENTENLVDDGYTEQSGEGSSEQPLNGVATDASTLHNDGNSTVLNQNDTERNKEQVPPQSSGGSEQTSSSSSVVRHSPRDAGQTECGVSVSHDVDDAIDGLVTRLSSIAEAGSDHK